jgi:hypothetical protein
LRITAGETVAYCHAILKIFDSKARLTIGMRKENRQWLNCARASFLSNRVRAGTIKEDKEMRAMLLKDKVAVIYGAGGAIGSAVARTFAREGARVFLSGLNLVPVEAVAKDIIAAGGEAEAARVDALDEDAVEQNAVSVAKKTGRIDVVLNAIGFRAVQGVPLIDLVSSCIK